MKIHIQNILVLLFIKLLRYLKVAELTRATECTEQDLRELRQYFDQICSEMKMDLGKFTYEREIIHDQLKKYALYF